MNVIVASVRARLTGVKGPDRRGWYESLCPFHVEKHASFGFTEAGFKCQACGREGNLAELARHLGVEATRPSRLGDRIAATYDYVDEQGRLLFQAVRKSPKGFFQRRPDGASGWVNDLKGVRFVPFRLPDVLATSMDQALFVVEGEKDVDRLWAEGLPATTNPMGAGKWRPEFNESLRGRKVVIVPDNDEAGQKHAQEVAQSLHGVAAEVRIAELPDLPEKGDVSDWLDAGHRTAELLALAEAVPPWSPTSDEPSADRLFPLSDAGNGELFAHLYGDRLRYDHRRSRWLVWMGDWWSDDADGEVRRFAKVAVRHRQLASVRIEDTDARLKTVRFAIQSESRQRIDALLVQAQTERPIADAGDHWDEDTFLFGVANGVVDLRTGALRQGRPGDRITQHSPIAFDPEAPCPRWLAFLNEVFGDAEIVDYIQRAIGYSLTGDTREQCLFLCHGKGSNGKSVLLGVLRALVGRYGHNAPFSLFEMHGRTSIPNDVAALVSRRLVTSAETNEGTRLNEARVKALTGGDRMTARFLYGELFEFVPVAKFWLAVNYKPSVADQYHGFWRRVRLIPFLRTFEGNTVDLTIEAKLRAELPGILAWAVQGAIAWQQRGLEPPAQVQQATQDYRNESDPLAQFLDECCVVGEQFHVGATELFKVYESWGVQQGFKDRERLTATKFGTQVKARYERRHTNAGKRYVGIGLRSERGDLPEVTGYLDIFSVTEAPGEAEVTGSVTGCEASVSENEKPPLENPLTREFAEKAVTTRHPVTSARVCKRCRRELNLVATSNLCERCKSDALRAMEPSL